MLTNRNDIGRAYVDAVTTKEARIAREIRLGKRRAFSNVVAFPTRKTHHEPTSVKYGPIHPLPVFRIVYDRTPSPYFIKGNGLPSLLPVNMSRIQAIVCRHFGVSKIDLIGERRTAIPCRARHVAIYLARTMTTKSLPEIGRWLGGRDHTTILHAYRKMAGLAASDHRLAEELAILEHKIKNGEG